LVLRKTDTKSVVINGFQVTKCWQITGTVIYDRVS